MVVDLSDDLRELLFYSITAPVLILFPIKLVRIFREKEKRKGKGIYSRLRVNKTRMCMVSPLIAVALYKPLPLEVEVGTLTWN